MTEENVTPVQQNLQQDELNTANHVDHEIQQNQSNDLAEKQLNEEDKSSPIEPQRDQENENKEPDVEGKLSQSNQTTANQADNHQERTENIAIIENQVLVPEEKKMEEKNMEEKNMEEKNMEEKNMEEKFLASEKSQDEQAAQQKIELELENKSEISDPIQTIKQMESQTQNQTTQSTENHQNNNLEIVSTEVSDTNQQTVTTDSMASKEKKEKKHKKGKKSKHHHEKHHDKTHEDQQELNNKMPKEDENGGTTNQAEIKVDPVETKKEEPKKEELKKEESKKEESKKEEPTPLANNNNQDQPQAAGDLSNDEATKPNRPKKKESTIRAYPELTLKSRNNTQRRGPSFGEWLWKLGGWNKGKWEKRYFEFQNGMLFYQAEEKPGEFRGTIILKDVKSVEVVYEEVHKRQCCFKIVTSKKPYMMSAESEEKRDYCITFISSMMKK